jgi:hypothetical protein
MASKLKFLSPIIVPLLVSPTLGTELTYKEYAKASEISLGICLPLRSPTKGPSTC